MASQQLTYYQQHRFVTVRMTQVNTIRTVVVANIDNRTVAGKRRPQIKFKTTAVPLHFYLCDQRTDHKNLSKCS